MTNRRTANFTQEYSRSQDNAERHTPEYSHTTQRKSPTLRRFTCNVSQGLVTTTQKHAGELEKRRGSDLAFYMIFPAPEGRDGLRDGAVKSCVCWYQLEESLAGPLIAIVGDTNPKRAFIPANERSREGEASCRGTWGRTRAAALGYKFMAVRFLRSTSSGDSVSLLKTIAS